MARDTARLLFLGVKSFPLTWQLDSQEDIVRVIVTKVVDSAFGFLPSRPGLVRERVSKLTSSWPVDYLGHVTQTG